MRVEQRHKKELLHLDAAAFFAPESGLLIPCALRIDSALFAVV